MRPPILAHMRSRLGGSWAIFQFPTGPQTLRPQDPGTWMFPCLSLVDCGDPKKCGQEDQPYPGLAKFWLQVPRPGGDRAIGPLQTGALQSQEIVVNANRHLPSALRRLPTKGTAWGSGGIHFIVFFEYRHFDPSENSTCLPQEDG